MQQIRKALREATSTPDLEQRLAALQAPRLDAVERSLPLPLLRSRMETLLDQADMELARARTAASPASPWTLLGLIARTSVASLALSLGFAGLAQRPGRDLSLLQELQLGWDLFGYRRRTQRRATGPVGADPDYFRQIRQQAEPENRPSGRKS